MKTLRVAFCVLIGSVLGVSLFAQNTASGPTSSSDFYVMQIPIEKIYMHSKGYVIEYRRNGLGTNRFYIPHVWFKPEAGTKDPTKAELVLLGTGSVLPYLAVYYKDGATDHIRLYVRRDDGHSSWGNGIKDGTDVDSRFDNVVDLKPEF